MIVYTPLDLPNIEPDNWDVFWKIWNERSAPLVKRTMVRSAGSATPVGTNDMWRGLDLYRVPTASPAWTAPLYTPVDELPNMMGSLFKLGLKNITLIRLVSSLTDFGSHTDDNLDRWVIRGYFYYTSKSSQWYFTKPMDSSGPRTYAQLPNDTMWFAYNDKNCWHGTTFDNSARKILIQITCADVIDLVDNSKEKYKDYTINYD